MIIDCHTHAFPREIRRHRENYFSGEPAFKLLYEPPRSRLVGVCETLSMMDTQGVDKAVIFGFPWKDAETCRQNNDYIIEKVARHGDRLIGLCCVDVFNEDAAAEVERCLAGGLSGVGELAFYQSGIDAAAIQRLAPVMEICRAGGCPIMIHTNEPVGHAYPGKTPNTLKQIYDMIRRFPENKIILAHWGGGVFLYSLLKKEVKDALEGVWLDTAASPFLYRPEIYRYARDLLGIGKILLGTDFPLLTPNRYFGELETAGLAPGEIEKICGGNAASLFMLKTAGTGT